ncbi:MAG: DegT/DnrJ/EryC1/StrS family aminotransferase [Chloroflexota bacterium]|nr:DegT/DnrJ/EryC1/StrS family aminotransferase [Chloroflexota bacterium]
MQIPLVDLRANYAGIKDEVLAAISGILDGMQLTIGPNVRAFDEEWARYCGVKHAVGVGSGTDALQLAIRALGIAPGDEVITVSYTFFATAEAIFYSGARPIFVDIDERTFNMDATQIEERITPRTKAIVPVHLYGRTADMTRILDIARDHNIAVIEDAAQAHGAMMDTGKRSGTGGRFGCFSFYCSKNLGAYGEAGAIVTDDDDLAKELTQLREHGQVTRYFHPIVGYNARLDEIQAAVLRIKLKRLDQWNARRRAVAKLYTKLLEGAGVVTPDDPGDRHVWHIYAIRVPGGKRDALKDFLWELGVGTGIHYPVPIHLQDAAKFLGHREGDLPVTEKVSHEILSLPMYPELTDEQVGYVADAVKAFMRK